MYEWSYPSSYARRFHTLSDAQVLAALRRLSGHASADDVICVATTIAVRSGIVCAEAEALLDDLLGRLPPTWIAARAARELRGIAELRRARLRAGPGEDTPAWSTSALMTCSASGHVRERALRDLRSCDTGGELPFLLVRANDWVPQVREVAHELLEPRVCADYAGHWVRQLVLLERLAAAQRFDVGPLAARVQALLMDAGREPLRQAVRGPDRLVRRAAARRLCAAGPTPNDADLLLASHDNVVRRIAARHLLSPIDAERAADTARRLIDDRFAPLAAEALDFLARVHPGEAERPLRAALRSRRTSLRHVAQRHLSAAGADLEALYAETLLDDDATARELSVALLGLGEVSTTEEAGSARAYIGHDEPRVRAAAVRALARLAPSDLDTFVSALRDSHPSVTRVALATLRRRAGSVPLDVLAEMSARGRPKHVRMAALRLLSRHDRSRTGPLLVAAAADLDFPGIDRARHLVERWLRALAPPAPALPEPARRAALAAFREHIAHLPDDLTARARRVLGP